MSNQSSVQMNEQVRSATCDLRAIAASRKSPGIVILNGLGEVVHLNDTAWKLLSLIRQHAAVPDIAGGSCLPSASSSWASCS